jgi:hypothetical protein
MPQFSSVPEVAEISLELGSATKSQFDLEVSSDKVKVGSIAEELNGRRLEVGTVYSQVDKETKREDLILRVRTKKQMHSVAPFGNISCLNLEGLVRECVRVYERKWGVATCTQLMAWGVSHSTKKKGQSRAVAVADALVNMQVVITGEGGSERVESVVRLEASQKDKCRELSDYISKEVDRLRVAVGRIERVSFLLLVCALSYWISLDSKGRKVYLQREACDEFFCNDLDSILYMLVNAGMNTDLCKGEDLKKLIYLACSESKIDSVEYCAMYTAISIPYCVTEIPRYFSGIVSRLVNIWQTFVHTWTFDSMPVWYMCNFTCSSFCATKTKWMRDLVQKVVQLSHWSRLHYAQHSSPATSNLLSMFLTKAVHVQLGLIGVHTWTAMPLVLVFLWTLEFSNPTRFSVVLRDRVLKVNDLLQRQNWINMLRFSAAQPGMKRKRGETATDVSCPLAQCLFANVSKPQDFFAMQYRAEKDALRTNLMRPTIESICPVFTQTVNDCLQTTDHVLQKKGPERLTVALHNDTDRAVSAQQLWHVITSRRITAMVHTEYIEPNNNNRSEYSKTETRDRLQYPVGCVTRTESAVTIVLHQLPCMNQARLDYEQQMQLELTFT